MFVSFALEFRIEPLVGHAVCLCGRCLCTGPNNSPTVATWHAHTAALPPSWGGDARLHSHSHQKRANSSLLLPLIECVTMGKSFYSFQSLNLFCCDMRGLNSTDFYLLLSEGWLVSIAICFGHSRQKAKLKESYSIWGCQGRRRKHPYPFATTFLCLWRSGESFKDPPGSRGAGL